MVSDSNRELETREMCIHMRLFCPKHGGIIKNYRSFYVGSTSAARNFQLSSIEACPAARYSLLLSLSNDLASDYVVIRALKVHYPCMLFLCISALVFSVSRL